ncbi:MAG: helix-turn-helix domain-containing protein [Gemmatimonadales bacterium]|nr:MAG: helix-turn-helix domain-containing protein [Gemmatimonadales bacterium]
MSKPEARVEAIRRRKQGDTLKKIARDLGVSPSSVHRWCQGLQLTERQREKIRARGQQAQMEALERTNQEKRLKAQDRVKSARTKGEKRIGIVSARDLLLLGVGLYWGEGSKRTPGAISMANMDYRVLRVFIRWLCALGMSKERLWARLVLPPEFAEGKEKLWWGRRLGLQASQFQKTYRRVSPTSAQKTQREQFHGILTVGCGSVDLWNEIMGMVSLAGFEPASLG